MVCLMKSMTNCGSIAAYEATLIGAGHQCQMVAVSLGYPLPWAVLVEHPGPAART